MSITADCCGVRQCNCRGWPRSAVEIAVYGVLWQLPRIGVLLRQFWRMAAECCDFPWKLQWIDVRGSCRGNCRLLEDCRGNCHGWPRNAAECPRQLQLIAMALAAEGFPWQLPWNTVAFAVDCRGNGHGGHEICRGTSVDCHGWYHGGCHGQNHGTCHGQNRGTCRGSAMNNKTPWPLPWKPANSHGSPWQDPRKTTQVPRSPPPSYPSLSPTWYSIYPPEHFDSCDIYIPFQYSTWYGPVLELVLIAIHRGVGSGPLLVVFFSPTEIKIATPIK